MTQFTVDEERPWLGGACVGGDDATYYPALWKWLVEEYGVKNVIDVGCGEGHALEYFSELGLEDLAGIDGVNQVETWTVGASFATHDFTTGPLYDAGELDYDLCWCCEFVEHVEERYIPNFLDTFQCADLVLMTHAFPGQPGYHHVNLREPEYWKGVMAAIGYAYDDVLTIAARELARENPSPWNHFVRSGLAFRRDV